MPAQKSALTFTQELLALLQWNSFEFEYQLTFRRNEVLRCSSCPEQKS